MSDYERICDHGRLTAASDKEAVEAVEAMTKRNYPQHVVERRRVSRAPIQPYLGVTWYEYCVTMHY
jgi:hypothetical protein